eukprot:CAMPEP_0181181832 /NCGR_PEP_ID=MMETSP1096-20121128/7550_1 /TAXON_ID=156174 ORGANISM="Chrysochromulina ericina, Strain CCMP281" /NCGR_SAMPLE_ID=MMETSP1096 /ASSEMBLY_ACC=CAM_ASM_000453 /LENGTH=75 /DNA_ID=CAMNT_0023270367 /DNA_START=56 /DNA_END=283 /DNA_ORIENTATION=-
MASSASALHTMIDFGSGLLVLPPLAFVEVTAVRYAARERGDPAAVVGSRPADTDPKGLRSTSSPNVVIDVRVSYA